MLSSLILALVAIPGVQHWTANSTTAMSITGDVIFTSARMMFSNGKSISLSRPRTISRISTLYIVSGKNPTLLRGNTLCGSKLPGYVLVARTETDVNLSFYRAGKGVPIGANAAHVLCATYSYGIKT